MMMKKIVFRLAIMAMTVMCLAACASKQMTQDEAVAWIAAYSPELIDMDSAVRIEPTDSLRALLDTTRLDGIFKFSPTVKGETVCVNGGQYIDFIPEYGALRQGVEYQCRVNMAAMTGIGYLGKFTFNFRVDRRKTKITDVKLSISPENVTQVTVKGMIHFSSIPNGVSLDGESLKCNLKCSTVEIIPTNDDLCRSFQISGIAREKKAVSLKIEYDPSAGFSKATATVTVPGLEEFRLLSFERQDAVQPYVELEFSAPLDGTQDLDGLVTIDDIDDLRIERNGTNVKVFYPNNGVTDMVLRVSELLRSNDGRNLAGDVEQHIAQEVLPPAVEMPFSGTILPDNRNLTLPFRAVNLAAVDVEVVKVYSDNVMTFLQGSSIDSDSQLRRVGRLIYRQTVRLDKDKSLNLHQWQNFSIDLQNLFREERGAIYNIRLTFCRDYSLYNRSQPAQFDTKNGVTAEDGAIWDSPYSYISRYAPDYNWQDFEWMEHDDPSKASYYMVSWRMPDCNLVASNLGLTVKRANTEDLWCTVSDIITASPLEGVRVTAYNYQMREIGFSYTNEQGFADFRTDGSPFIITASDSISTTYLKMNGRSELSTSRFNVGGKKNSQGIKGFIYGERGVWRPGDDIYLTLILEDSQHSLPANHPVTMELYTPEDQLYDRQTLTKSVDGFYSFHTKTQDNAPTGGWKALFMVGGQIFRQNVRIETIKPNRLKINVSSPDILSAGTEATVGLEAHWLAGPVAEGLQAKMEMSLFNNPTPFEAYTDYIFANPLYEFSNSKYDMLSDCLDSLGRVSKNISIPLTEEAPGMLQANLIARVMETSGDESMTSRSVRYSPYSAYVGVKLGDREFETDTDLSFPVVAVDADGNALDSRELEYKIYRLDWSWWREGSAWELNRYVNSSSAEIVASGDLMTDGGVAEIPFRVDYPSWGRYLVFVRDIQSGHATGGKIYIDYPDWRGHSVKTDPSAPTMLSFSLDKKTYEVGDVATVYLPRSAGGRALLSFENGSRVLSRHWVSVSPDKETAYKFNVTKDMAPNFYVHTALFQPYAQTVNDLPIRMYGVEGAEVVNRSSILHPEIAVADEILPQKEFSIRVSEHDGKRMTYTLAIVDEGLLDITSFKTPQPWRVMNQREALGVRTWDMYNDVRGAFAGNFTPILSIGGDEALRSSAGKEKRFNPVVMFLGPFTLEGGTKTHKITLPMYVGSVRVMVVAAHNGSYGSADRTVTVRSPLMVLPTLPRTLANGDRVKMPINVFATNEGMGDVTVELKAEGPVSISGGSSKTLSFPSAGEQMIDFELLCDGKRSGQAKVTVMAHGGGQSVSDAIYVDVRNPQPLMIGSDTKVVGGGETKKFEWDASRSSEGDVRVEVATMPTVDFSGAFAFVENYNHYCTEQLSSRAMYMLYARRFLDQNEQVRAEKALPSILKTILSRQLSNGGFAYWQGSSEAHEWATSMAGEVMTEARRQGFAVDGAVYNRWKDYQKNASRTYHHTTDNALDLVQAYRLYTLVMAGENPSAAMNKLRESKSLSRAALIRLAATYAVLGRKDVAKTLLDKVDDAPKISGSHRTFYSSLRNLAMETEGWALAGDGSKAIEAAGKVADLFSPTCCSTQEVAFVSAAMNRLADIAGRGDNEISVSEEGKTPLVVRNLRGVKVIPLQWGSGGVSVKNEGNGEVYVSLTTKWRPLADEAVPSSSSGVDIKVYYTDLKGDEISVEQLKQGKEFVAHIKVESKRETESMALTFAVPSGWEIWNDRLMNGDENGNMNHIDIRDESIRWYFGSEAGKKREFAVRLRAAWCGKYILPVTVCEDMYDPKCRAVLSNYAVEVVK